jgi:predicted nucleic acid-binding protein
VTPAYFDTSALVKNYVQEVGSARAGELLRSHTFLSSSIVPVELMSALIRRKSRRELRADAIPAILARVRHDRPYWKLMDVGAPVLSQAEEIIQSVQMRALDAIHIASLLAFQAASGIRVPFVTADGRQRDAAEQMKLDVVWVG